MRWLELQRHNYAALVALTVRFVEPGWLVEVTATAAKVS